MRGIPTSQENRYAASIPQPLMAYGPSPVEVGARAANFAAQILGGINPGDLPLEYADFVFSIDLSVAEGMGFYVPDDVLHIAHEVVHSDISVYSVQPAPVSESGWNTQRVRARVLLTSRGRHGFYGLCKRTL